LHRLKTYTYELIGALAHRLLILTRLVTFDSSLQKVSPIQHKTSCSQYYAININAWVYIRFSLKGLLKLIFVIFYISWTLAIGSINDIYETLTRFLSTNVNSCINIDSIILTTTRYACILPSPTTTPHTSNIYFIFNLYY
jgi:uncharacterized membrane protein